MPHAELRLLALDGGGVRGLSALMILEQLMEAVNPDAPPKPCDYFDMIGGTSTGGLITVMLGRLRMSVADSIDAYLSLSARVFRKTKHRVTVNGKIQGRFDSEELAQAIKEVVKGQGLQDDALLKDAPEAGCKVFVCATSKETSETVCLTSYRTPRGNSDLLNCVKIWEACRATSAASSFFDPITVGRFGEEFVDGATGANNPVREVWDQAQLVWGSESLEGKVKCLVSIGTGVPSLKPFKDDVLHIGETLVAIATETNQTAERFRRERLLLDNTGRYYRFNVLQGLENIGLEEAKKVKEIAAATRRYIALQEVHNQMQACAGNIAGRAFRGQREEAIKTRNVTADTGNTIANATIVNHRFNITINCAKPTEVLERACKKIAEDELLAKQVKERFAQRDADLLESSQGIKAILWSLLFGLGFFLTGGLSGLVLAGVRYMSILEEGADEAERDTSLLEQAVIDNSDMAAAVQESLEEIHRDVEALSEYSQGVQEQQKAEESRYQQAEEGKLKNADSNEGHQRQEPQQSKDHNNQEDARRIKELEGKVQDMQGSIDKHLKLQEELKLAQADLEKVNKELEHELDIARERQEKMQEDFAKAERIRNKKVSRTCLQKVWEFFGY